MPLTGVASPMALALGRSRLGSVLAIVGVGLLIVGAGDALGRTGRGQSLVVPFFLAGLTLIFAPCAWRLTGAAAARKERLWVSVILGLGLLASYVFRSPLIFDNADELAHGETLVRLLDSRALFETNPVLPISSFYPGIELVTAAIRWLTGLPLLLDQMVVLVLARILLVLCVSHRGARLSFIACWRHRCARLHGEPTVLLGQSTVRVLRRLLSHLPSRRSICCLSQLTRHDHSTGGCSRSRSSPSGEW